MLGCDDVGWVVSSMMMVMAAAKKTVVSVVIAALALFCLGDVVHAVVPETAENAGCESRFCDEPGGCGTGATVQPPTSQVAMLVVSVVVTPPLKVVQSHSTMEPALSDLRQVAPLAPRSPPSA